MDDKQNGAPGQEHPAPQVSKPDDPTSPAGKPQEPMPYHPAAAMFPLMEGEEQDKLVADIAEHGQQMPIILHEGMILDGRNRERACRQLGIEPRYQQYDGKQDPADYVYSVNEHRRHLTVIQRAEAAAKRANLRLGSNRHETKVDSSAEQPRPMTQAAAAHSTGASVASVRRIKFIEQYGTDADKAALRQPEAKIAPIYNRVLAQARAEGRYKPQRKGKARARAKINGNGKSASNPSKSDDPAKGKLVRYCKKVAQACDDARIALDGEEMAELVKGQDKLGVFYCNQIRTALDALKESLRKYDKHFKDA
jgi:ParB-like chromosome segregation protein Spo0J